MNNRIIGLAALVAFVAIVPPTLWHDHLNDPWAKWVYDYQPLIAGAFAIFAAYLTVNTMRETDDRQESRHQELMRLNLRRDQLIARRAAHPQVIDIQECERDVEELIYEIQSTDYNSWIMSVSNETRVNSLTPVVRELKDVLLRDQLDAVKPLLDQRGYRALQILRRELDLLVKVSSKVESDIIDYNRGKGYVPSHDEGERRRQIVISKLEIIGHQLPHLNESIVVLAGEYE
ncbi:hypothetical protein Brsp05_02281 [Brucella sp. NBRC 12953]|uniref:hypothetical protein n=1 Tax=Brucella sp. NBRC 12953 TaxID=3075481 RepID=UPI0030953AAF